MLNVIGLHIEINRGDAAGLTFHFNGDDAPEDGAEVIFKVMNFNCNCKGDAIIEKVSSVSDGEVVFSFTPEDTEEIEPGLYYWNACIQYMDGSEPWTILRDWQNFLILQGN